MVLPWFWRRGEASKGIEGASTLGFTMVLASRGGIEGGIGLVFYRRFGVGGQRRVLASMGSAEGRAPQGFSIKNVGQTDFPVRRPFGF